MSRMRRRPGRLLFGHGHGLWADWICRRTCRSSRWRLWVINCWTGPRRGRRSHRGYGRRRPRADTARQALRRSRAPFSPSTRTRARRPCTSCADESGCRRGPVLAGGLVTCLSCRTRALASWRAQHRAHRGGHLPGAPLAGVIFCEGAPQATGAWRAGRVLGRVPARLGGSRRRSQLKHHGRAWTICWTVGCRWPACWLRVLLVGPSLAGGSQQAGGYPARSAACSEPRADMRWPSGPLAVRRVRDAARGCPSPRAERAGCYPGTGQETPQATASYPPVG